jgi:hypothetical protein
MNPLRQCVKYINKEDKFELSTCVVDESHTVRARELLAARRPGPIVKKEIEHRLMELFEHNGEPITEEDRNRAIKLWREEWGVVIEAKKISAHRQAFDRHECTYVGRVSTTNAGYCVPSFCHGSFLANPFPVGPQKYTLTQSLALYEEYLNNRIQANDLVSLCTTSVFPEDITKYLSKATTTKPGKMYDYLRLTGPGALFGSKFKEAIMALKDQRLGCFCDLSNYCHVDVLLRTIDNIVNSQTNKRKAPN